MAMPQEAPAIKEIRVDDPEGLMRRYKETGDVALRNQLVMHYIRHINIAIRSMKSILLSRIPYEDFFNQGVLTLMECIERYEPERGEASFDTYCYMAIRGSLLKYLRRQCWLPNRLWEIRAKITRGRAELEQTLQREPSDAELAAHIGLSEQKLTQCIAELSVIDMVSFEELLSDAAEGIGVRMPEAHDSDVSRRLLREELQKALGNAIDALPPKEKQIISLYYYENLNMREIGEVLDLSQQRISQCRLSALEHLRGSLRQYELIG